MAAIYNLYGGAMAVTNNTKDNNIRKKIMPIIFK